MNLKDMDASDFITAFLVVVLVVCVVALLVALPVMFLWNWLIPDITQGALTPINFWQALGMSFLCQILFRPTVRCNCKK